MRIETGLLCEEAGALHTELRTGFVFLRSDKAAFNFERCLRPSMYLEVFSTLTSSSVECSAPLMEAAYVSDALRQWRRQIVHFILHIFQVQKTLDPLLGCDVGSRSPSRILAFGQRKRRAAYCPQVWSAHC